MRKDTDLEAFGPVDGPKWPEDPEDSQYFYHRNATGPEKNI